MHDRLMLGMIAGSLAQLIKFSLGVITKALFDLPKHGDLQLAAGIFLKRLH